MKKGHVKADCIKFNADKKQMFGLESAKTSVNEATVADPSSKRYVAFGTNLKVERTKLKGSKEWCVDSGES